MDAYRIASRKAELYCAQCREYDGPRLKSEVLPDGVVCDNDIAYIDDGSVFHLLDIYYPSDERNYDTAYFLTHGGAFVYGDKVLDRNFGMRLAQSAGIPVVNVNYTLLPNGTMRTIMDDLSAARDFLTADYGFKKFHFTGDSAGGALAVLCAVMFGDALSVSPICGCYTIKSDEFPGALFAGAGQGEGQGEDLPPFIYDLKSKSDKLSGLDLAIITGDEDFLREDNLELHEVLPQSVLYDAVSAPGRSMTHVFPIAHPEWPEGQKTIEIISSFARKAR